MNLQRKENSLHGLISARKPFPKLKQKLKEVTVSVYPRPECQFILDTDACDIGISAVLSQLIEGEEKVIPCASRILSKSDITASPGKNVLLWYILSRTLDISSMASILLFLLIMTLTDGFTT